MDFAFSQQEEAFRQEVRDFIKKELPPDYRHEFMIVGLHEEDMPFTRSMSKKLAAKGWLTMSWPREYGGQARPPMEQVVYWEECSYYGVPGTDMGIGGILWIGPSLMLFGTEQQKRDHIPPIARGERFWCTGFSEPGSGSDLSGLQCRARLEGDHYVVDGQKIWTSAAHVADWMWLAVRTNPDAPKKSQGISVLIVDMKTSGITVRRLKNPVGAEGLNEVFFDNVRVPKENVVGGENNGWLIVSAGLAMERGTPGVMNAAGIRRLVDDLVTFAKEATADGKPLRQDPFVHSKLANFAIEAEIARLIAYCGQSRLPARRASSGGCQNGLDNQDHQCRAVPTGSKYRNADTRASRAIDHGLQVGSSPGPYSPSLPLRSGIQHHEWHLGDTEDSSRHHGTGNAEEVDCRVD